MKYQVVKEARLGTNSKSIISKEYYNLLNIFFKKSFDILLFHQKYDHKIILERW